MIILIVFSLFASALKIGHAKMHGGRISFREGYARQPANQRFLI
jgi:hypothetical protein